MARAGFNPAGFGEHSLRAGFATEAARNGAAFDVMRQTGHRSIATVFRYVAMPRSSVMLRPARLEL